MYSTNNKCLFEWVTCAIALQFYMYNLAAQAALKPPHIRKCYRVSQTNSYTVDAIYQRGCSSISHITLHHSLTHMVRPLLLKTHTTCHLCRYCRRCRLARFARSPFVRPIRTYKCVYEWIFILFNETTLNKRKMNGNWICIGAGSSTAPPKHYQNRSVRFLLPVIYCAIGVSK